MTELPTDARNMACHAGHHEPPAREPTRSIVLGTGERMFVRVCRHCYAVYLAYPPSLAERARDLAEPLELRAFLTGDPYRPAPTEPRAYGSYTIARIPCSPTTRHSNKANCAPGCGSARRRPQLMDWPPARLVGSGIIGAASFGVLGVWALLPALFWAFVVWPACMRAATEPRS